MLKAFSSKVYQPVFLRLMKDGPVYGYELTSRIEKMTNGHLQISFGTVYPILRRMEKSGLITSTKDETSGRVYYELTPKGKLAQEKLESDIEETKKILGEKLLGSLAIYHELFGKEALDELLKQTK
ncbi:TPA: helix-turn-helix transcriptional regulator [Candidatus Bathyarchaeota archaeon]|nr:helix-turn-helix transcriptional regulator [Candidatus Bathyarchaeota archaeon]HIJ08327.1 helix-turn-helix transcriptional regulator [Candidatus Bathyarchaeota archaeon]